MKSEDRFVERLRGLVPESTRALIGIGDDAAVLRGAPGDLVATMDLLVERVDFLADESPEAVGRRAVAVNCSDLAAMGALPEWFLLGIAFPSTRGEEFPLAIARGAATRGAELGAELVGGDLSRAESVVVAVTLAGRCVSRPLRRSGAKPGEVVFVSGFPGRAAAGLRIARGTTGGLSDRTEKELLAAYRDPEPRLALGRRLAAEGLATAAIDVSDGLGVDAGRLARASGARVVIERERLPLSPALAEFFDHAGGDPLDAILAGGDDYELLFTSPPDFAARVDEAGRDAGTRATRIGRVEEGAGVVLEDAAGTHEVSSLGYDHFEARR
ncbi:MAG TPA: thiamine-phosphate kinase [Thermoanaerobaculia bacterium]